MKRLPILIPIILFLSAGALPAFFTAGCRHDDGPCLTCPPPGPDTTSHNFIWTIDTLGDGNNSVLYDVAIVNDTLAYAVGEIYLKDSTGGFSSQAFGFAIWNGRTWTFKRVSALGPTGITSNLTPRGIFAFSATNIWIASGGVFFWNGQSSSATPYWINSFPGNPSPVLSVGQTADKLWGSSSVDLFAVGRSGGIAHYNGSMWQKIESGTTIPFVDVWGGNETSIWFVGSNYNSSYENALYHFDGVSMAKAYAFTPPWTGRKPDSLSFIVNSVWTVSSDNIWASTGDGIYRCASSTHGEGLLSWGPTYTIGSIELVRGSDENNIFAVGYFGTIAHYNGSTWRHYGEFMDFSSTTILKSVSVGRNTVIAVGQAKGRGLILTGRHY